MYKEDPKQTHKDKKREMFFSRFIWQKICTFRSIIYSSVFSFWEFYSPWVFIIIQNYPSGRSVLLVLWSMIALLWTVLSKKTLQFVSDLDTDKRNSQEVQGEANKWYSYCAIHFHSWTKLPMQLLMAQPSFFCHGRVDEMHNREFECSCRQDEQDVVPGKASWIL